MMQDVKSHYRVCCVCGFADDHPVYTVREMMFGLKEEFCYFHCVKCQCLQIAEIPSDMSPYYQQDYLSLSRSPENLYLNPVVSWARRKRDSYSVLKKGVLGRLIRLVHPEDGDMSSMSRLNLTRKKRIVDVGCGTGILFSRLDSNTYTKYVGIDISRQAINQFDKIKNDKTKLLQSDLESFRSNEKFDIIIFCESLSYSKNPQKILNKYAKYLSKKGKIIISIFEEDRTVKFWEYIPRNFQLIDATKLQNNNDSSWRIKLFELDI